MSDGTDMPKRRRARRRESEEELPAEETTTSAEDASAPVADAPVTEAPDLGRTLAELAELRDRELRLRADFDNFRKRAAREQRESEEAGKARLMQKLLPVLDNLERALKASEEAADEGGLTQGIEMVRDQLVAVLQADGLVEMDAVGALFDATKHEALCTMPSEGVPEGHVIDQVEKGYVLGDRVLRPAKVIVACPPS